MFLSYDANLTDSTQLQNNAYGANGSLSSKYLYLVYINPINDPYLSNKQFEVFEFNQTKQ
jgi:hypothetical protein